MPLLEVEIPGVLESIVESMGDGVVVADGKGNLLVYNAAAERILGLGPVPVSPKDWPAHYGFHLPDGVTPYPAAQLPLARAIGGQATGDVEIFVRNPGVPQGRWVSSTGRPLRDGTGGIRGGVVVFRDITDQKRAESFMRHLPGIAFIKDFSGRYLYINEASASLLPFNPKEIVGKLAEDIWPPEVAAQLRENDRAVLRTGQPQEVLENVPLRDGLHSWLMYKFPIPGERGEVSLLGGIGIDITARKRMEEQLQQSSKMDAVSRLAGAVAHDFNNLLTVVSGYGQMLLEAIETQRPAEKQYVEALLEASKRAAALTNQLLAFSGRQVIQPKVVDLNALVRRTEKMLRRVIGGHIELCVETADSACTIMADSGQLEQMVMHLAANARDAMRKRGKLEIRTTIAGDASAQRAVLEIADSGEGMDAETKSHLFEPFFTSKGRGKGMGMGLSTVYGIVKQSGGEISVDSELGRGTTFRIAFPCIEGLDECAPPSEAVSAGHAPVNALDAAPPGLPGD